MAAATSDSRVKLHLSRRSLAARETGRLAERHMGADGFCTNYKQHDLHGSGPLPRCARDQF
jgi:hypothetical protein